MKYLLFILLLAAFVSQSCCQTLPLYTELTWDYDYKDEVGAPLDSTDIYFMIYKDSPAGTFNVYTVTQTKSVWLLADRSLYNDNPHAFYARALNVATNDTSVNSDTTSAFFRKIILGKPYDLEVLAIPVVE